jgi:voltage-gated potassium channel Kch
VSETIEQLSDDDPTATQSTATADVSCRGWTGHVIVCGLQAVGVRTIEQLIAAGARVVVVDDEGSRERHLRTLRRLQVPVIPRGSRTDDALLDAGIAGAESVICIEVSDLRTLETVLLVHGLRPDVRVVAQLDNPAVARAVEEITGQATVIDVASLFAPSVIEACVKRRAHDIRIGSTHFVTVEVTAARDATLRELYGSLVPLGVVADSRLAPVVCPGRDHRVREGDRVTLLGTREEVHAQGFAARLSAGAEMQQTGVRLLAKLRRLYALWTTDADRSMRIALGLGLALLVISTLVLHFGYENAVGTTRSGAVRYVHLGVLKSIYFTVETIATVGFGDYSYATQATYMEIFGIFLIIAGTTLVTTIFALLTNMLVSRRIAQSLGQAQIPGMSGHVVMVGLGAVGIGRPQGI